MKKGRVTTGDRATISNVTGRVFLKVLNKNNKILMEEPNGQH